MNELLIPTPDTIPVNWLWFEVLLVFTFIIHLVLMNFILGGSLLTLWDMIRGKQETHAAKSIPTLIALTINFGVPPLLFVQVLYGHLFYTSSVIMAIPWILVIPILILAYYGAYIFTRKMEKAPGFARIGLIISSVFMLYIAFIFVNNNTLYLTPDRWSVYFDRPGGMNLNMGEPTLWPRYLHFLVAALAIGALGRAIYYHFSKFDDEVKAEQIRKNLKIFGWMTLVQVAVGTWFWLSMPKDIWMLYMGKSIYATVLMVIGWLCALGILHAGFTGRIMQAIILALVTVTTMVLVRDVARRAYLDSYFHPSKLENVKELSPFIAFLLVFVVGLFLLYYMIRLMSKSNTR